MARLPHDPERALQFAKRVRRRVLFADYADAERLQRWKQEAPSGPYEERVFRVRTDPAAVRSLLVFKPDEIGDAVYGLPAVAELRRAFPDARVSLVCQALTRGLYERSGLFDEIVAIEPRSRFTRPTFDVDEVMGHLEADRFDLAVFLRVYRAYFQPFLQIPATMRAHPVDPALQSGSVRRAHVSLWSEQRRHMALQMLEIVAPLTGRSYGFEDVAFPEFGWTAEDREAVDAVVGDTEAEPVVVVHPFVKHETRRYPMEWWPQLIQRARKRVGGRWVVVGGPSDPQLPDLPDVLQTQGRLSLTQTGHLLSRAAGCVGILSGPAHWSAALGTPTVTIMGGEAVPLEWAPLGRSLVIRGDVPCAPCHQRTCPVYGLACLTQLEPDRILDEVTRFLADALPAQ